MSRRPSSAPAGVGARGGVLLALAVVLGIVLLQAFDTGGGPSSVPVAAGDDTLPDDTTTTLEPVVTTTSTVAPRPPADVKVLTVNGSGKQGVGGLVKDALQGRGYNALSAVTATSAVAITTVQYEPGYESDARAIAALLDPPATKIEPVSSPPVKESDIRGANVIVLLGADISVSTSTTRASTATTRATTSTTRSSTSTTRATTTTTR